jgi:hypothetical protein
MAGARYEISVDGIMRTHRDLREIAVEAANYLKARNPHSKIVIRDLATGETTEVAASLPLAVRPVR